MRIVQRLVGSVLLVAFAVAPLGVAAEGYVCASGKRMMHGSAAAPAACAHCQPALDARASGASTFSRPCCVYVGSTALPPAALSAGAAEIQPARAALVAMPGVTATAGAATALVGVPRFEFGGSGASPPPVTLQTPLILRN